MSVVSPEVNQRVVFDNCFTQSILEPFIFVPLNALLLIPKLFVLLKADHMPNSEAKTSIINKRLVINAA